MYKEKTMLITSLDNKKIKEIAKLKQKKYRDIENKYRSIQAGEC